MMTTTSPGAAPKREPAIRVVMMPKDTNALGTIFGGVILSFIDQAGAVEAHRRCPGRIVTVAMREVVFHAPVFVGDLVSLYTKVKRVGTPGDKVKVTEAEIVFVHVDENGTPQPIPKE